MVGRARGRVVAAFGAEDSNLLLGAADEQHLLGAVAAGQVLVRDVVLALPLHKIDQRHPMVVGVAADRGHERLATRCDQRRGCDIEPEVAGQEAHDLPDPLQLGDVEVEVEPVDRLDLEHHMTGQHICCSAG